MSEFRVGDDVSVSSFSTGARGVIVALESGGFARVQLKGLVVRVPTTQLVRAEQGAPGKDDGIPQYAGQHAGRESPITFSGDFKAVASSRLMVLDLHGMTVREAVDHLDQRISQCMMSGLAELEVMHGVGSGAVREAVHERLSALSVVARYEVKTTNRGVTRVFLRIG